MTSQGLIPPPKTYGPPRSPGGTLVAAPATQLSSPVSPKLLDDNLDTADEAATPATAVLADTSATAVLADTSTPQSSAVAPNLLDEHSDTEDEPVTPATAALAAYASAPTTTPESSVTSPNLLDVSSETEDEGTKTCTLDATSVTQNDQVRLFSPAKAKECNIIEKLVTVSKIREFAELYCASMDTIKNHAHRLGLITTTTSRGRGTKHNRLGFGLSKKIRDISDKKFDEKIPRNLFRFSRHQDGLLYPSIFPILPT